MLLDIAIIVFLMVAAILLILAEIFLLPGITLAGSRLGYFRYRRSRFRLYGRYMGRASDFILINHYIRNNLRLVIAFPVF